ncbi:MAG: signal peptidase I [Candidatus Omnitrophica bacterium]|nr:signal peptidase I [Candidatus Omnitrophota bacterium]
MWSVGCPVEVSGSSMEPAYQPGSRVRISRTAYWFRPPARGDVVAIRAPAASDRVDLKRIIGLPGEEVSWTGGRVAINGRMLDEPYANIPAAPPGDEPQALRLGPGEYFVAGDHRLYSRDSRAYGPVKRSAILGKILV